MEYLILGASAAGLNAAKTIRKLEPSADIHLISECTKIYSRSMLPFYISGKRDLESMNFVEDDFFKKYNIKWTSGVSVLELDTYFKEVLLSNNRIQSYDKLLIATGSSPFIPSRLKNISNSNNIFTLGTIEDAMAIKERIKTAKSAIIIGGGLVGIDIVSELLEKELDLTILEYGNNILAFQLNRQAAKPYEDLIKSKGVNIITNVFGTQIYVDEDMNFEGILLNNGKKVMADMLILSSGVKPNTEFLENSEILIDSGVVEFEGSLLREGVLVNKYCETNRDDVYAAGDVCAEKLGIWPLAVKQGIVAGHNMTGHKKELTNLFGRKISMNYFGINTISLGNPNLEGEGYISEEYNYNDVYKRIVHKDGIIYSAILQNDLQQSGVLEMLIKNEIDISDINKSIFDIGYSDFFDIDEEGNFLYDLD